jgi:hypothetical protein
MRRTHHVTPWYVEVKVLLTRSSADVKARNGLELGFLVGRGNAGIIGAT